MFVTPHSGQSAYQRRKGQADGPAINRHGGRARTFIAPEIGSPETRTSRDGFSTTSGSLISCRRFLADYRLDQRK